MPRLIVISFVSAFLVALLFPVLGMLGLITITGISFHGWVAFTLAIFGCFLLSGGLFALTFYSARSGRDDLSR